MLKELCEHSPAKRGRIQTGRTGHTGMLLGIFGALIFGALIFGALILPKANAQVATAAISGTVKDATGAVIAGATVTATSRDTGAVRTAQTGADGHYSLHDVPVGSYDVKSAAAGFQAQVQQNLTLNVAQEAVLNFALPVGSIQQTVTVTAEAPLVDTTSGALGGLVNDQKMTELPLNGRSFSSLVLLQTGVNLHVPQSTSSTTSIGLAFSSNGAPIRSNYTTLDGTSLTSSQGITGVSMNGLMLGVDAVQEFRVINNNFPAQYGMTMGSQIIMVSKGGSNQFHGTVFDFLRSDRLDANDYFLNWHSQPRASFRRNNFGGSLGGPVRKDKDFFFVAYEGLREDKGIGETISVPSPLLLSGGVGPNGVGIKPAPADVPFLNLFPKANGQVLNDPTGALGAATYTYAYGQPSNEDYGQARYDHTFSENDQFFTRYTIDDSRQIRDNGAPGFVETLDARGQYITVAENHIFSPTVLNSARLSYQRPFQGFLYPVTPGTENLAFYKAPGIQMGSVNSTVFSIGGGNNLVYDQNSESFSDDLSWTKGNHSLKFGTLINRFRTLLWTNNGLWGTWTFNNIDDFLTATPKQLSIISAGSKTDRTYRWNTFGFYGQDEWRVLPRLTLNLGLRYEFNTTVNEVTGAQSSVLDILHDTNGTIGLPLYKNPSLKNFSPRFAFAWDVFGDGKTSLRGGFGIFYDIANLVAAADIETTGTLPYSSTLQLTSNLCFPSCTAIPNVSQTGSLTTTPPSLRTVLYQQAQPHLLSYNMTLDRQLPGHMLVSVGYAGSRGLNIIQTSDGNPIIPISNGVYPLTLPSNASCAATPGQAGCRVNPLLGYCECKTTGGDSWYNALQVRFQKQMSRGLQFQLSYTFSKTLDDTQGQHGGEAGGSSITGTNPWDRNTDKGPADFNIPQSFSFNSIYTLPSFGAKGLVGVLANGWRASGIMRITSGLPFSVTESNCRSNSMVLGSCADRVDIVPGCQTVVFKNGDPNSYLNPLCFALQPGGTLGTEGRNDLTGPMQTNLDFSLVKETKLGGRFGEGKSLEFRLETFNLLNTPTFNIPAKSAFSASATKRNADPAGFGQITNTINDPREIQLALKFIF